MEKVLIFGVTGQDGSYLAEQLLDKGHKVVGVQRRTSANNLGRLDRVLTHPGFSLLLGDINDYSSVYNIISQVTPHWIINLAAMSHVGVSFQMPSYAMDATCNGFVNILEAVRLQGIKPRIYQASSSEMFGDSVSRGVCEVNGKLVEQTYQDIHTPFNPQSPYAIAKMAAHRFAGLYRESYGLNTRCGILFNHESPRRGENFVTRKITRWLGDFLEWQIRTDVSLADWDNSDEMNKYRKKRKETILINRDDEIGFPKLRLGNIDTFRDWGHAKDYMVAVEKIMRYPENRDWVVSTGETYSIRDFLALAFRFAGFGDWQDFVYIDKELFRPSDVPYLKGMAGDTYDLLDWIPNYRFETLVKEMVDSDLER